jgi:hypothetical protein
MNVPRALVFVSVCSTAFVAWVSGCGGGGGNLHFGTGGDGSGANGSGASGNGASGNGASGNGASGTGGGSTGIHIDAGSSSSSSGGSCTGLQCQIHACSGSGSTIINGTILDPAGKNPLYGVVAYVPNTKPAGLTSGASCTSCDALYSGDPIAAAVSGVDGKFSITKAPDGTDIPLVIQVGKWRRQFVIPSVAMCASTEVTQTLSLPKNGTEGDLPNIAISTGGADTLECLLTRVGVDDSEYVAGASPAGHVHIFQGKGGPNTSPPGPSSSSSLWGSDADIMPYDITLLSCEGSETSNMNQQVMMDYTNSCGRVFASHFHYAWFDTGPFAAYDLAKWTPGSNQIGSSLNANVVTTFTMGMIFEQWLAGVAALTNNELTIYQPRHNADVTAANGNSQAWLTADNNSQSPGAAQDFSFDTPLAQPAAMRFGRVVYSDMHVGATGPGETADYNGGSNTVPTGCAVRDLSAQEKALEFILFNLSSCVQPLGNDGGVMPPPVQTM